MSLRYRDRRRARGFRVIATMFTTAAVSCACSTSAGLVNPAPGKHACLLLNVAEVQRIVGAPTESGRPGEFPSDCAWTVTSLHGSRFRYVEVFYGSLGDFSTYWSERSTQYQSISRTRILGNKAVLVQSRSLRQLWVRHMSLVIVVEVSTGLGNAATVRAERRLAAIVLPRA